MIVYLKPQELMNGGDRLWVLRANNYAGSEFRFLKGVLDIVLQASCIVRVPGGTLSCTSIGALKSPAANIFAI